MPARFQTGNAPAHFSPTVESHYYQIYFEILAMLYLPLKHGLEPLNPKDVSFDVMSWEYRLKETP